MNVPPSRLVPFDVRNLATLKRHARVAGLWYLALAVIAPLSALYIPSQIIVKLNAAVTATNIQSHIMLFRLGVVGSLASNIVMTMVALNLYRLLRDVDRSQARLMVALALTGVGVANAAVIPQAAAGVILGGASYWDVFPPMQRQALAYGVLQVATAGSNLATAFWGLWLFPFAVLVIRSGFMPPVLGWLLILNGIAYVVVCLTALLFPASLGMVLRLALPFYMVGELSIIGWLLAKGVRRPLSPPELSQAGL